MVFRLVYFAVKPRNKTTDTAVASDNIEDRNFENMIWSSLAA
jgi:hypothetical protein